MKIRVQDLDDYLDERPVKQKIKRKKLLRIIIAKIKSKVNKITSDLGALVVLITLYMKRYNWLNIFWWIFVATFALVTFKMMFI